MEQHPIPQQISSYQFKLVGDMTLKQFFQVAGGALVGLLFYSTPLHPLIKWPIILISTLLGVALAFLPFQERPLEKWLIAFFRSIYSPTIFKWKKSEKVPNFFTEDAKQQTPLSQNLAADYLASTPQTSGAVQTKLETAEKSFLSKITSMWSVANQPTPSTIPVPVTTTPTIAIESTHPNSFNPNMPTPSPVAVQPKPEVVAIPQQIPVLIPKTAPRLIVEEKPNAPTTSTNITAQNITAIDQKPTEIASKEAEFSIDAAPPNPPTVANTVVGQVIDQDRKIIPGAILEIRDSAGRPVRALKSNLVGHFIIVTPLLNGKYEINTEKDGFTFEPISFTTEGVIIPPIAIKGVKLEEGVHATT